MGSQRKYPFRQERKGKQYDWIAWTEDSIKRKKKFAEDNETRMTKDDFVSRWNKDMTKQNSEEKDEQRRVEGDGSEEDGGGV